MIRWDLYRRLTKDHGVNFSNSGSEAFDFMFKHSFRYFLEHDKLANGKDDLWTSRKKAFVDFRAFITGEVLPAVAGAIKGPPGRRSEAGPLAVVKGVLKVFENGEIKQRCKEHLEKIGAIGALSEPFTAACGEFFEALPTRSPHTEATSTAPRGFQAPRKPPATRITSRKKGARKRKPSR